MPKKSLLVLIYSLFITTSLFAETAKEAKLSTSAEIAKKAQLSKTSKMAKNAKISKQAQQANTSRLPKITLSQIENLFISKQHRFVPTKIMDGGSLYLIKGYFNTPQGKQSTSLFLSQDRKTGVYGRGFSTSTSKEYKTFIPEHYIQDAIINYGHGRDEYFLFTDPLCPYCKNLEKELYKYKDVATFHIFLLALPMHKKAPHAINYILSQTNDKDRFNSLIDIANEKKDYLLFKADKKEKTQYDLLQAKQDLIAKEFKVRGTPSIYTKEGSLIPTSVLEKKYAKQLLVQEKVLAQ